MRRETLTHRIIGRRTGWLVLLLGVLLVGALSSGAGAMRISNDPTTGLPAGSQSARVARLQRRLPGGETLPALVVFAREPGQLTAADRAAIAAAARRMATVAERGPVIGPILSRDGRAALLSVPLLASDTSTRLLHAVRRLRHLAGAGLPHGLRAQVTGAAAFEADIANSFSGADVSLLLVTVLVVAVLLIVTYRSPLLFVVPLAVVGMADGATTALVTLLSRHTSLPISQATTGIVTVIVFGAGTDYALLLISRYRQELLTRADHRDALEHALRAVAPAILASAGTVILSLLSLLLANLRQTAAIGACAAVGIAVVALFGLLVLPAALSIVGRRAFWPAVPRAAGPDAAERALERSVWARAGRLVQRRSRSVVLGSAVVLGVLAVGLTSTRLGLSQTQQFRVKAPSVTGLATLGRHFPAGASDPVVVVAPARLASRAVALTRATPGVASPRRVASAGGLAEINASLRANPDTPASFRAIRALRARLRGVRGLVGGTVATNLDVNQTANRDLTVIVPVILAVVLVILVALLRSLLAPVLLTASVVASYLAALGAGTVISRLVLGYPGIDNQVPLLSFLFLVALGIDYNIFLITRAREETFARHSTPAGVLRALAATGGVITSAGILLAAVFAALSVIPVIVLTEVGIIVGVGVLLDTLLVRTATIPALAVILGERFWWPAAPARRTASPPTRRTASPPTRTPVP